MIYNSAEEQVKDSKQVQVEVIRLAEVTSLDSKKRAKVKFFGEDTESGKTYTYIDGYIPAVGDKVAMIAQGNTFIILGAVVEKEVIVKYALKDHNHDTVYVKKETYDAHTHSQIINGKKTLGVTESSEVIPGEAGVYSLGTEKLPFAEGYIENVVVTYITIDGTQLEKEDLISKIIASGSDKYYVELEATDLLPYTNKGISLGTSMKMFKNVYAQSVFVNGKEVNTARLLDAITSGRYIELSSSVLEPSANEAISVGTSSKRFLKIYVKTFYGDEFRGGQFYGDSFYVGDYELSPSKMYSDASTSRYIEFSSNVIKPNANEIVDLGSQYYQYSKMYVAQMFLDGRRWYPYRIISDLYPDDRYIDFNGDSLKPNKSGSYNIGTSTYQYKAVYAQNVYINGSAVSTSDKRKKKFIRKLADKYLDLFRKLRPVTFKYKKGTSGRTHTGFIAQEVEQAMQECGITNEEFGGLVIQENGEYGIRYEEIIALQTAVIQDLQKRVEELERRVGG